MGEDQQLRDALTCIRDMAQDAYIRPCLTGEPLDIQVELSRIAVVARDALDGRANLVLDEWRVDMCSHTDEPDTEQCPHCAAYENCYWHDKR